MSTLRKKPDDVYGHLLWDHYRGQSTPEIIEMDDGRLLVGMLGPEAYFSEFKQWPRSERTAMKLAWGRVLDIGCGAGRHSLYVQGRGQDATGIDTSPLAIRVCKLRGLRKAKVLSISELDRFREDSFDSVIMMGNNFGLFGSFRRARRYLKALHRITSPRGRIIAQTTDPYKTTDPDHLAYQQRNRKKGRMAGQLRFRVRHKKFKGAWFDYLLVSKQELAQILAGTGWKAIRFMDFPEPPGRYIMLLEKE